MEVDQPECGAGRASQPRKMGEYEQSQKKQAKMSIFGLWVAIWWC
jgi:hypothetical protein